MFISPHARARWAQLRLGDPVDSTKSLGPVPSTRTHCMFLGHPASSRLGSACKRSSSRWTLVLLCMLGSFPLPWTLLPCSIFTFPCGVAGCTHDTMVFRCYITPRPWVHACSYAPRTPNVNEHHQSESLLLTRGHNKPSSVALASAAIASAGG